MRRYPYFSLLCVLLLVFGIVALSRGWVAFSGHREVETRKVNVEVTVDPEKAIDDATQVKDAASRVAKKAVNSLPNEKQDNQDKGTQRR